MCKQKTLLLAAICLLPIRTLLAHENTKPAYAGLLASLEASSSEVSAEAPSCSLTLTLVDAETQEILPSLVRIRRADGSVLRPRGLLNRGTGLRENHAAKDWSVVLEPVTLFLPQTPLTIEAISGLETEMNSRAIDLTGVSSIDLRLSLTRFFNAADRGWRNGNTHLHLKSVTRELADRYLASVSRADGLELVFVSHLRRPSEEKTYVSNSYTADQLRQLSGQGVTYGYGEEHRHNFGPWAEGYGHVMFLNIDELIRPVSIGSGIMGNGPDWPPMRHGITRAHEDDATVIWCHNTFGFEDIPNWLAGVLHAHNIFDGGTHGSYEDTFYRFMDVGLRVPFSTGTDWFIYDFSRVYVQLQRPLSIEKWLNGLERGKTFITNGPLLEFSAGDYLPGDVVQLAGPTLLEMSAQAVGRQDFQRIEVVFNGQVKQSAVSRRVAGHYEAKIDEMLLVNEPGWLAFRVYADGSNELGERLFGHTSAIYIEIAGKQIFKPQVANQLIADMTEAMKAIREKATFDDDQQAEEVLDLYRQGITTLRQRLERR